MMVSARKFLGTPAGKGVALVLCLATLGIAAYSIKDSFAAGTEINTGNFVCSETGKFFEHTIKAGESIPVESPYSGKKTGYMAESCFWTKDGKLKSTPTLVLMNQYAKKPGPTFCPDCGRLVTVMNPPAMPGAIPPPTEAEYKARGGARAPE